jgi:hypothetical protein
VRLREELGYPLLKDPAERAKWVKPAAEAGAEERAPGAEAPAGDAAGRRAAKDAPATAKPSARPAR